MNLNIGSGMYQVGTGALAAQECINLYPEVMEKRARSRVALRATPGLTLFSTAGTGPIRAMDVMSGVVYVVSGGVLYSISSSGTATSLGTVGESSVVTMEHNSIGELMILVGGTVRFLDQYFLISGRNIVSGWIYTVAAGLVQITDTDFPTGDLGSTFWSSNLNNGSAWTATDFSTADGSPDPIRGIIVNHRDLLIFGHESMEPWRDQPDGTGDFPFRRQEGRFQERGCASERSIVAMDNTIYFLGDDRVVYRIDEIVPVRVSDHGVEQALESATIDQIEAAVAFSYTQHGHYFYCLTFGDSTWVFDATTSGLGGNNVWHRRTTGEGRWRGESYAYGYGKHLLGDYSSGQVWALDQSANTDGGLMIRRVRSVGPVSDDIRQLGCHRLELTLLNAVGTTTSPQLWLEISKDDGRTWSPALLKGLGKSGEYSTDVVWRRLGKAKSWIFRWTMTDANDVLWIEAYGDFTVTA